MAGLLNGLIADCDTRLAALSLQAAEATEDGALKAARAIHAKSLELRRDLGTLQAMQDRLVHRFFAHRDSLTSVTSA